MTPQTTVQLQALRSLLSLPILQSIMSHNPYSFIHTKKSCVMRYRLTQDFFSIHFPLPLSTRQYFLPGFKSAKSLFQATSKIQPAARRLSRILLGTGGALPQVSCGLRAAHRRPLRLPGRLFGAFRRYRRRARTSRGGAPFRASRGRGGRRPSPYVIPASVRRGRIGRTPVRSVVNRQAAPDPWI